MPPPDRGRGATAPCLGLRPLPPWTEHVFVGAGDRACLVLGVGARGKGRGIRFPVNALALKDGAGVEKETTEPKEAYARFREDRPVVAGRFDVVRRVVRVPQPVVLRVAAAKVFHFVPQDFVDAAAQALRTFSERYAPYPWSTYTVVVATDRPELGEEYPTIVFVSPDLGPQVVTHETAHQWFYSLVGNNQARDPWLDETLAEWATARLWDAVEDEASIETPANVRNRLGEPMTFWGPLRFMPTVWDGLYLQGVKAFASLGGDDAVDCALQRYAHENAYETAQPRDLLAALTRTFPNAEAVLTAFGARF